MSITALAIGAVMLVSCYGRSASVVNATSPQGDTWDSIKHLPDWSGVWTKNGPQPPILDDCCIPGNGHAQLTPKYQMQRDAAAERIGKGLPGGDNLIKCLPDGMPGILLHGVGFEYLFTPGKVTMLIEDGEVRRIYTDGRGHPNEEDLYESYEGHSIGHWEGNVLVVDTIGIHPRAMLFLDNGLRVTKKTHIVERITLKDADTQQIETTIDDPNIFTQPYSYKLLYTKRLLNSFESGCTQYNRDMGVSVDLTPPEE